MTEADDAGDEDDLRAVDELLVTYGREQEEQEARARAVLLEQRHFAHAAACRFDRVVRPTLEDIAERLNRDGGGGLVEERPAQGRRGRRLTLWMSLEGPVVVPPRVDQTPYVQFDVDVPWRRVTVWEGDMWNKLGASRATEPFTLDELTAQRVTQRAISVLRRAVDRGGSAEKGKR
jgi:hypothetical protein